jgi:large subunit ribosomal protein L17e
MNEPTYLVSIAARAHGEYLRTHFKNMREVAAALTGKTLSAH